MKRLFILSVALIGCSVFAQKIPSKEAQIAMALTAAPESLKADATVLGYDQAGKLVTLREGKDHLICLTNNPSEKGFSVACYSGTLEPYMAKGRDLLAEGKSEKEKREIRGKEIEAGTLKMPQEAAAVYVLTADEGDVDFNSGHIVKSHTRYVFYKPYMTAENTGLPTKPEAPGMPWLMDPGTHRSHIMITPPKN